MATCDYCGQEMTKNVGCTVTTFDDFPDEVKRERIPNDDDRKCHDCGAPPNKLHHPGCDNELCPKCEGQAISCGCTDSEGEDCDI